MNVATHLEEHKEEYKKWLVDNEQGRVDIKVLPYLKDIKNGFFLEAGALDGLFMSNTKILEDLGWNGILVEPSVEALVKCKENRKCMSEWGCLVSKYHKEGHIFGDFFFDGEGGKGAWSSVHKNNYAMHEKIAVPAFSIDKLLKFYNINKVDFLSLDVEGYELNVLKGIDFETTEISFILIEVNFNDYALEDLEEYLGRYGYKPGINMSNFTKESNPDWNGSHQDYFFTK